RSPFTAPTLVPHLPYTTLFRSDHEERRVHVLDLEDLPREPEERAEPAAGRDDLEGHDDDERKAEAEPQAGEDERQRAGQEYRGEESPAPRPVVHGRLDDEAIDLSHAVRRRERDQEERSHRGGHDQRDLARGDDEAHERQEQDARDRVDHREDRIEPFAKPAPEPHREPDRHAEDGGQRERPADARERRRGVPPERAVEREIAKVREDRRGARKEDRAQKAGGARPLPRKEQRNR